MRNKRFGNAETHELWDALNKVKTREREREGERDEGEGEEIEGEKERESGVFLLLSLQVSSSSSVSVSDMMDTWTKQMGYPVITISASNNQRATVSQRRFFQIPLPKGGTAASSPFK